MMSKALLCQAGHSQCIYKKPYLSSRKFSVSSRKYSVYIKPVYANGVLVSHPDIFNDGLISIHGVDKLLLVLESSKSRSHGIYYSPHSADPPTPATVIRMPPFSSASSGPDNPMNNIIPFMLESTAWGLRDRRYRILALAMCKTPELLRLKKLTIFTLSDDSVFLKGGLDFTNNLRYHVVPNRRHLLADLVRLPVVTRLHTLLYGQSLVVTDAKPFSVNGYNFYFFNFIIMTSCGHMSTQIQIPNSKVYIIFYPPISCLQK